jgi:acetyltransferase
MSPLRFLPPHLLNQLMNVDYHARMAFVASHERDGREEFVGIARYGETNEPAAVEMGGTVRDAWQRQGVARLLIAEVIRYAIQRGFKRMCGYVPPEASLGACGNSRLKPLLRVSPVRVLMVRAEEK